MFPQDPPPPPPASRAVAALIALIVAGTLAGCGATLGPPLPANILGPNAGVRCPAGTMVVGAPPPRGQIVMCVKVGRSHEDKRARIGPVVSWACSKCKDGAALHGQYILGARDGMWTLVSDRGRKIEASEWHHGKRYGKRMAWYADGTPHFMKTYGEDGKKHGRAWSNHPDGTKSYDGHWVRGVQQGYWKLFSKKGKPEAEGKLDRNVREGEWKLYDGNGELEKRVWYDGGKVKRVGVLVKGKLRISSINDKGQKTGTWSEKNGKRHGVVVEYWPGTETVAKTTNYDLGVPRGPVTLHREDGTIMASGALVDGKKQCGWKIHDAAGKDISRRWMLAEVVRRDAKALGVNLPASPCDWDIGGALAIRQAGSDVPQTLAAARWLIEHEVGKTYGDKLATTIAGSDVRLQVAQALLKQATTAIGKEQFVLAALIHVAALVEANRALGGTLLQAGPTLKVDGGALPAGPRVTKEQQAAFKAMAKGQLEEIGWLLSNREKGQQSEQKAGRITLGRIGLDKLTMVKFRGQF